MPLISRHALRARSLWRSVREYMGGSRRREVRVTDRALLAVFLETRASFVAQTSLYGYLRTRAGMRYPELFDNDSFAVSINIAKWQIWLACVSDLAVYSGGLLARGGDPRAAGEVVTAVVAQMLDAGGVPEGAGPDYPGEAARVRERLANCDWGAVTDDEGPFAESPGALVRWAPVMEELKALDEGIVRNSVRFRWQEVRREARRCLDAKSLLGAG